MQDLRDALRALRANPLFSLVAVLSLALGIGANTAIFSLINSVMLRSLPVREPVQLVRIEGSNGTAFTNPIWEQFRDRADFFDGIFAWGSATFNLAARGPVDRVTGFWVSGGYMASLGVTTVLGRGLTPADDTRGGGPDGPVTVISYGFWQRRFGGSGDVVGRPLTMNGIIYTIVGVTGPEFFGTQIGRTFDILVPIGTEPIMRGPESNLDRRSTWWLNVMARLRPGQTAASAEAAMAAIHDQVKEATVPQDWNADGKANYLKEPFKVIPSSAGGVSALRTRYERPLWALMVVVGMVLLIACANIANLLLARATARRHELSVRQAIGATRWRLARQMLAESVVLSAAGAALGLIFAFWGSRLLARQLSTQSTTVFLDLSLDWRILGFTALVSMVTALIFGTAPALRVTQAQPIEAMKEQGRGTSARGGTLSSTLVAVQVALSLVLVVVAGLFVRTFSTLSAMDTGFDKNSVLIVSLGVQQAGIKVDDRLQVFERIRETVGRVPGVASAAVSQITPVSGSSSNWGAQVIGQPSRPQNQSLTNSNLVSADWFKTYGITIVAGRAVESGDRGNAEAVAVVNEAFERKFLDGTRAIGHQIRPTGGPDRVRRAYRVVGVARDAVYRQLRDTIPPTMYLPITQSDDPVSSATLSVRAGRGSPMLLSRSVTEAVASVNPQITVSFTLLSDQIRDSVSQERLVAILSGFFGILALLLAALGLYGVTSYSVTRRRTELGIYLALGSAPADVVTLVLRRVALMIGSGIIVGAAASWWLTCFVGTLLYGLQPRDPFTFVGAAVLLAAIGALAGWIPARRAAGIDPAEVLREG